MSSAPQTSPELGLPSDRDLCHAQAAQRFVRAGELDRIYISTWQEMGFLALEAESNKDWELLGYSSMGSWMQAAFPKSRSVVYAAWGAVKELQDVDPQDLKQISHSTAHVLKKLPKAMRSRQDVILAAKSLSTADFIKETKTFAPEAHIEQITKVRLNFEESQFRTVEAACDLVKLFHPEIVRYEDCWEVLASDYLLENQSAFEKLRSEA